MTTIPVSTIYCDHCRSKNTVSMNDEVYDADWLRHGHYHCNDCDKDFPVYQELKFGQFDFKYEHPIEWGRVYRDTYEWLVDLIDGKTFRERVKTAMKARKITQKELAGMSGCSVSLISSILNNRYPFTKRVWSMAKPIVIGYEREMKEAQK